MTPFFFKIYKPRTYNYKPIYYDPQKEARKEREEKYAKNEDGENKESSGEYRHSLHRGSFREELEKERGMRGGIYRKHSRQSNTRLIIIVAILAAVAYLILR